MASLNFGPQWMRRSNGVSEQSNTRAASPKSNHPDTSSHGNSPHSWSSVAAGSLPANGIGANPIAEVNSYEYERSKLPSSDGLPSPIDTLNPFKYSKDFILKLYKPSDMPIDFERHDHVTCEECLSPMAFIDFTEHERKLLASNTVNPDAARRNDPRDRTQENRQPRYDGRPIKTDSERKPHFKKDYSRGRPPLPSDDNLNTNRPRRRDYRSPEKDFSSEKENSDWIVAADKKMVGTFEKGVFKVDEDAAKERLIGSDTKEPSVRKHVSSNVINEFHRPENRVTHETAFNRPASPVRQVNTSNHSYSQAKDQPRIHNTDQPSSMHVGELEASPNPAPSVYPQLSASSLPFTGTAASLLSSTLNSVLDVPGAVPPKLPLQEPEYARAVQWHYCDPVGNIQGPFTSEQMQNWYEGKYLPNDLPVRATFQSSSGHVSDSGNFELLRIFIMKYCGNDYATPFLSAKKKTFSPSPSFLSDPLSAFPTPSLLFQPGYQQTQQPSLNRPLQTPTTFDPFGSAAINQLPVTSNTEQREQETGYGWGWTGAPQDSQLGATVDAGISTHFLSGLSLNPQSGQNIVAGLGQSGRVTEELNNGPSDPFSLEGLLNQSAKLPRERHTTGNAVMDGTTEQDRPDVGYEQAWKSTVSNNTVTAQFHDENGPTELSVNENLSRLNIGSDESSPLIPSHRPDDTTAEIVETNDSPVSKVRPSPTSPVSESRRNLEGLKKSPKSDGAAVTHKGTEATESQRQETHTKQKLDIAEKDEATEEQKEVGLSASAPWATQNKQNGKLTLQEIMKQEEKRKTKVPATRQTGALSPPSADSDIMPTTISWGIAPSAMTGKANVTQQISHVQPAAWSTPQNLPVKKSLADIQREEEEREKAKRLADKEKQALSTGSAASAGGWGSGVNVVRRYADTVGTGVTSISSNNQAVVNVVAAKPQTAESNPWLTVGTKAMAKAPAQSAPARPPVMQPVAAPPQPTVNIPVMTGPSEDFVKWCKSSLSRLSNSINLDDFLKMLLEFPVEDDSVSNTTNMIHELILSVSTTIDGRKFADEFVKKRRANLGVVGKLDNSTSDKGFQVVKNVKKNRRK